MKKLSILAIILVVLSTGCNNKQTECIKSEKQISKMTSGIQYSHCYDANYTW